MSLKLSGRAQCCGCVRFAAAYSVADEYVFRLRTVLRMSTLCNLENFTKKRTKISANRLNLEFFYHFY